MKSHISSVLKKSFTKQIKEVNWRNKIAVSTTNLAPGKSVVELEVLEIKLYQENIDLDVLKLLDRGIPYHILFILEYEGKYQAWIGYKEEALSGNNAFKVNSYYHTEWLDEVPELKLQGLNMDDVYEGFLRQVAGDRLGKSKEDESLKESVDRSEQREALKKQISVLEVKLKREKQLNRQVEINRNLKKLRKELTNI